MSTSGPPFTDHHSGPGPARSGASLWFDAVYLAAGCLLTPFFLYRRFIKKKKSAPLRAKMGHIAARPALPRIWVHAVSVGETIVAETLVKALKNALPETEIVISTTTVTGQEVAAKRFGPENVFFYPHDFSWVVRRVLNRVKPTLIVLMELEVWPNLTAEATRRGIPVVVVNGRITERAARRYKKGWALLGPAFRRVHLWLAQTEEYATRLRELGVSPERIELAGNIKYDAVDTVLPDAAARSALRNSLGLSEFAPVLIGGSTHPTEETSLLVAYGHLRQSTAPDLRLILVPRHPERFKAVEAEAAAAGFPTLRRSMIKERGLEASVATLPSTNRDSWVLLVDTVGELKILYSVATVAFIGGSLIPHGGQNVMEPCGLGIPTVHGPHMHNFNDAMEILRSCEGSVESSRDGLTAAIETLLLRRPEAEEMASRARDAFLARQGAASRAVEVLSRLLSR